MSHVMLLRKPEVEPQSLYLPIFEVWLSKSNSWSNTKSVFFLSIFIDSASSSDCIYSVESNGMINE
jgi:hypothetical protein